MCTSTCSYRRRANNCTKVESANLEHFSILTVSSACTQQRGQLIQDTFSRYRKNSSMIDMNPLQIYFLGILRMHRKQSGVCNTEESYRSLHHSITQNLRPAIMTHQTHTTPNTPGSASISSAVRILSRTRTYCRSRQAARFHAQPVRTGLSTH